MTYKFADVVELSQRIFNPVLPIFEVNTNNLAQSSEQKESSAADLDANSIGSMTSLGPIRLTNGFGVGVSVESPLLRVSDANSFLAEVRRSSRESISSLDTVFNDSNNGNAKIFSIGLISFLCHLQHLINLSQSWANGMDYIEYLLRQQLIAAIGKELTASDFNEYMKYHSRKIFKNEFQTAPLAHAIRRDDLYPEGEISIEAKPDVCGPSCGKCKATLERVTSRHFICDVCGSRFSSASYYCRMHDYDMCENCYTQQPQASFQPVEGFQRQIPSYPLNVQLNASTSIVLNGERYAHGLLFHEFGGETQRSDSLELRARTRQFSSFILCVGSLQGSHGEQFSVKSAMIVQNRDELRIPLLCECLPSAKEFKDAIESLSPEQQRFCKQYRKMQLSSSLFALLVIQIKPQLEKVLNLQTKSLIKEIQIAQDVLELFITYQIPPDQLSYNALIDGAQTEPATPSPAETASASAATDASCIANLESEQSLLSLDVPAAPPLNSSAITSALLPSFFSYSGTQTAATYKMSAVRRHVSDIMNMIKKLKQEQLREEERKAELAISKQKLSLLASMHQIQRPSNTDGYFGSSKISRETREDTRESGKWRQLRVLNDRPEDTRDFLQRSHHVDGDAPVSAPHRRTANEIAPTAQRVPPAEVSIASQQMSVTNAPVAVAVAVPVSVPVSVADQKPTTAVDSKKQENNTKLENELRTFKGKGEEKSSVAAVDLSKLPQELDSALERYDLDGSVRPTTLKLSPTWSKLSFPSLLSSAPISTSVDASQQDKERNRAFDLLDCLSRSGSLSIDCATLHVIVAVTHCFDKSLMDTVIQCNVNPIEKCERTQIILAQTLHQCNASGLLKDEAIENVKKFSAANLFQLAELEADGKK